MRNKYILHYILLIFITLFLPFVLFGQTNFVGIYNGLGGKINILPNDTLFIDGNLFNNSEDALNVNNSGTIILTDSLVNLAGILFKESSTAVDSAGAIKRAKPTGQLLFYGNKPQYIWNMGSKILLANVSVRDTVQLLSDINIVGTLQLNRWNPPSRLLLNGYRVLMFDKEDVSDLLICGQIKGEDETHYITDTGRGLVKMIKHYEHDTVLGIPALEGMGLHLTHTGTGHIIVSRLHQQEEYAASGSVLKYYEIDNQGSGFSNIGIHYFKHDLQPEHYDSTTFQLFFSNDGVGAAYKGISSKHNSGMMVASTENVETHTDLFRYTIASKCALNGICLGDDKEVCLNTNVTITPFWKNGIPSFDYSLVWNGDEQTREAKSANNSKTFVATKDTTITLRVMDTRGCMGFDTVNIKVRPLPVADIKDIDRENQLQCITHQWNFALDSIQSNTDYAWTFADGSEQQKLTAEKIFVAAGKQVVKLTAKNRFGCIARDSAQIEVEAIPVADFIFETKSDKKLVFIDQSQYNSTTRSTRWTILGNNHTEKTIETIFPAFGQYPVKLKVLNNKCADSTTKEISISTKGSLAFGVQNSSLCQGDALAFDNESVCSWGAITYLWDFGDGEKSSATHPVKTYHGNTTAAYTVTLYGIDPNTGWRDSVAHTITVNRKPLIGFGDSIATCTAQLTLSPEEPGYSYLWSNGVTSKSLNITQSGNYWLQVTNAEHCEAKENVKVILNSTVKPTITDVQSCGIFLLDAGNPNSDYLWNTGHLERTLMVEQSGIYSVAVTQANGCIGSKTVNVVINERPEVKIQGVTSLCSGTTAILSTAQQTNVAYHWNTGDTSTSIMISGANKYKVIATNKANLCTVSDSITIIEEISPNYPLGEDRNICLGQQTVLTMNAYDYATEVLWWNKKDEIYTGRNYAVADTGTYYLKVTLPNGCSSTSHVHFAGISTPLTIDFLAASEAFVGDSVVFIDLSYPDPVAWKWKLGSFYETDQSSFHYSFWNEGIFDVHLSVSNGGCVLSGNKKITIRSRQHHDGNAIRDKDTTAAIVIKDEELLSDLFVGMSNIISVKNVPNPSNGNFTTEVELETPSRLLVKLYDLKGFVLTTFTIPENEKKVLFNCNFDRLPTGIYFLRVWSDNDEKTTKIIKN